MKQISVAVIGCGRIAGHHCRNIVAQSEFQLAAVCDLEMPKAKAYGDEFSVPYYSDYRKMLLAHPEVNLVAIITPSGMHFEHAREIVSEFKKNVVVEKPTFLKLQHIRKLYDLAAENNVKVFPVFQNRYNKAVQRVANALKNDELGKLNLMTVRVRWCRPQRYYDLSPWRGTFAMDGGALTNQGIHHVDLLRYLGGDVLEVQSHMRTFGAQIEVEDTCVATMKFANGAVGTLEVTTSARPTDFEASISILGDKGMAQIGGIAVNELQIFTPDQNETKESSEDFSSCVYGNGHGMFYRDVSLDLNRVKNFPMNVEDVLNSLSLLHSFYVSNEQQRTISPAEQIESIRLGENNDELAQLYRTPRGQNLDFREVQL